MRLPWCSSPRKASWRSESWRRRAPHTASMTTNPASASTLTDADRLRAEAASADQSVADSFERSDTDGFLSQWAGGLSASKLRAQADIADNDGRSSFLALFNLDGELVPAKHIPTRFGMSWMLLASDDPDSEVIGWFNESQAQSTPRRLAANRRKGFTVGRVQAKAYATLSGGGTGLAGAASVSVAVRRADGGFSRDVIIDIVEHADDF